MLRYDIISFLIGEVAFVAVFFTLFILAGWCIKRRHRQSNSSSTITSPSSPSPAEVDALVASFILEVERLKKIWALEGAIVVEEGEGGSAGGCTICLEELKAKELARVLPNCAHMFHYDCIEEWLMLQSSCPLCRRQVFTL